jgi:SAM-dependent methyltransferase
MSSDMVNGTDKARTFFENEYGEQGFDAQRRFPNEELCRFMGRNFFHLSREERREIDVLEVGCGSGANLWMIAREGFNTFGLDLSDTAVDLCKRMLRGYNCKASLMVGDMCRLPLADNSIDVLVDIFSSHCLDQTQGAQFLSEIRRCLRPKGKFFSYFPSARSDTFTNTNLSVAASPQRLDTDTLNGLYRRSGPFYGNDHPFRFLHPQKYSDLLIEAGFDVTYLETVGRTYRNGDEYFEFVVVEAQKIVCKSDRPQEPI